MGKESNRLEDVEHGVVHDWQDVQDVYTDPKHDDWATLVIPVLKLLPASFLADASGLSVRTIKSYRNLHSRPHAKNRRVLLSAVMAWATTVTMDDRADPHLLRCAARLVSTSCAATDRA